MDPQAAAPTARRLPDGFPRREASYGRRGLGAAVLLALLMHGALFAAIWRRDTDLQGAPPAAIQITALQLQMRQVAPVPAPLVEPEKKNEEAPVPPPVEPTTATATATASAQDALTQLPDVAEGELEIAYPDAPLPGGHLALHVLVRLDAEGRFRAFEADAPLPEAFAAAIERGLGAARFMPGQSRSGAVDSALCLALVFDEMHPEVEVRRIDDAGDAKRCLKPGA